MSYVLAGVMASGTLAFVWLSAKQFQVSSPATKPAQTAREIPAPAADPLAGLWLRRSPKDPDTLRFYYFHGNGKGLYRYGRRTLNQTNSFDYRVRNQRVWLKFRKDGQSHDSVFEIQKGGSERVLRLHQDPKEDGASYKKIAGPMSDVQGGERSALRANGIGGRMWIHARRFAQGGGEFGMYQFNAPAMDGRGVGWFHRGDFDDWSTESFRYRVQGTKIDYYFEYQRSEESASFELYSGPRDTRFLLMKQDPRNYWLDRRYRDMGPSFGAHPAFTQWTDLGVWANAQIDAE